MSDVFPITDPHGRMDLMEVAQRQGMRAWAQAMDDRGDVAFTLMLHGTREVPRPQGDATQVHFGKRLLATHHFKECILAGQVPGLIKATLPVPNSWTA
jgi:hypothetical protein